MQIVEAIKSAVGMPTGPVEIAERRLSTARADLSLLETETERVRAEVTAEGEIDYDKGGVASINGVKMLADVEHRVRVLRSVVAKRETELAEIGRKDRADRIEKAKKRLAAGRVARAPAYAVANAIAALSRIYSRELSIADIQVNGMPPDLLVMAEASPIGSTDPECAAAANELMLLGIDPAPLCHPYGSGYVSSADVQADALKLIPKIEAAISKLVGFDFAAHRKMLKAGNVAAENASAFAEQEAKKKTEMHHKWINAVSTWALEQKLVNNEGEYSLAYSAIFILEEAYQTVPAHLRNIVHSYYMSKAAKGNLPRSKIDKTSLAAAIGWTDQL